MEENVDVFKQLEESGVTVTQGVTNYVTSEKFIGTIVIIILVIISIKLINKFISRLDMKKFGAKNGNLIVVIRDGLKALVYVIGVTTALQINGVNTTSLIAGLGIASTVVALSLQDGLKDVISGIHIIIDGFFRPGDVVQIGEYTGIVKDFNVRTTVLKSVEDDSIITICNRNISNVVKISDWFDINVPLSYDENVDKVNKVLSETVEKIKKIPKIKNCDYLGTQDFGDSAILYKIRVYTAPAIKMPMRRTVIQLLQKELDANNLSIPFAQFEIHQV